MNTKVTLAIVVVALIGQSALASGFSLYEPSAISHAMGGALVGKAMDASANFNNPATLTDLTNLQVTVGFITEHPRGEVCVNGKNYDMDPGPFVLPCFMMSAPLPYDFTIGLGISAEYGLGTEYGRNWVMNWSTVETTVQGLVINPNLSYKITDKWSVGVGARWLYFTFEQDSSPLAAQDGNSFGQLDNHLKGDNGWKSIGWQIGTKYDILDNLSVGAVYKSAIDVTVEGDTEMRVKSYDYTMAPALAYANGIPEAYARQMIKQTVDSAAAAKNGNAEADLTLPQSIAAGVNWDVTKKLHLGSMVSWTQWSKLDSLNFILNGSDNPKGLYWHDTWRASFGAAYDFHDDWTGMISYVFDMDCTDRHQTSAMLPPADRHILAGGLTWRCWRGLELTLSYSCIFMDGGSMETTDALGRTYRLKTEEGFCHAGGFSATYRF